MLRDYYDILEVSENASSSEIKRAYRRLARKYHPDSGDPSASESIFQEVTEAYTVLSDKEKRAEYDEEREPKEKSFDSRGSTEPKVNSQQKSSPKHKSNLDESEIWKLHAKAFSKR